MMTNLEYFAERIRVNRRLPEPIWATGIRLEPGRRIQVVLHGAECVVPARAIGKYERGRHVIWHTDHNGRKWRLRLPSSDIIVGYK